MRIFAALALAALSAAPTGDKPELRVRVEVSNFYIDADRTYWAGGHWQLQCGEGMDPGAAHLLLQPHKKGVKRELFGRVSRKDLAEFVTLLRKDGIFTAKDSKPCGCDAPNFIVSAQEGKEEQRFKLVHNHDDHDQGQRRIVDAIIAEVERLATSDRSAK